MLAIDAGHGGSDPGCHWPSSGDLEFVEKEVTLAIAKMAHDLISQSTLIRTGDYRVSLGTRAQLAKDRGCTHAAIIHCDAITKPEVHGLRVYILPGRAVAAGWSSRIIANAPAQLKSAIRSPMICTDNPGPEDDWFKRARVCLLPYYALGIEAILIECGFSTNGEDRKYLLAEKGQAEIGLLLCDTL